MLKKGIAAVILFAASSSVYAGGADAPPPAYIGGAYMDLGLSSDSLYGDLYYPGQRLSLQNDQSVVIDSTLIQTNTGAQGFDGFMGLGYSYVWNNKWSLSAEVYGDATSAQGLLHEFTVHLSIYRNSVSGYYSRLRLKYSLGASLMPGYFIAPGSLYFLELGYVKTAFDLTGFPVVPENDLAQATVIFTSPLRRANPSGFRLGFGTNTQIGSHIAIRQEYIWESYRNFSAQQNTATQQTDTGLEIQAHPLHLGSNISKYNLAAVYYFAPQANAPDLEATPAHLGGNFYLGLSSGNDLVYSNSELEKYLSLIYNRGDANNLDAQSSEQYRKQLTAISGWDFSALAGYGWNFQDRWYLGAELSGSYTNVSGRYSRSRPGRFAIRDGEVQPQTIPPDLYISFELGKQWDFGASLIPGYQVSDAALLYARIGYLTSDFKIKNSYSGLASLFDTEETAFGAPDLLSFIKNRWLNGLQLGVGVDTLVYKNLSLRAEFDINTYRNFNVTVVLPTRPVGTSATQVITASTNYGHIVEDKFNIALIWHFFH